MHLGSYGFPPSHSFELFLIKKDYNMLHGIVDGLIVGMHLYTTHIILQSGFFGWLIVKIINISIL